MLPLYDIGPNNMVYTILILRVPLGRCEMVMMLSIATIGQRGVISNKARRGGDAALLGGLGILTLIIGGGLFPLPYITRSIAGGVEFHPP